MKRHFPRRSLVFLLAAGALLLAAATAVGAGDSITLHLKGGYRNQQRTACSARHHYKLYHRHSTLHMDGYVSPAPARPDGTWRVKIKVKRCEGGQFVTIWQAHTRGKDIVVNGAKVGYFRKAYRLRRRGYFFARAYYYGYQPRIRSQSEHFRVTR